MGNITERIELFHNLYLGFLGGTILCFLLSAFLFWKLDIRGVFSFFTGKQAKREISKLQDAEYEKNTEKPKVTPEIKKRLGVHRTSEVQIRKVEDLPTITVTKKLEDGSEELTSLLRDEEGDKTTILEQSRDTFYVEREIVFIHTEETIE